MNLNEILKAHGIEEEAIGKILAAMKENKIFTAAEENLDIRYGKLKTDHEGVNKQLTEANALIEEMKKATKGQEDIQKKLTDYEAQNQKLIKELERTKLEAEIKVNLLSEGCLDVDYAAFKLREKGDLALDENGKIKGWEDKLAGLKTQIPAQFESAKTKQVMENRLPQSNEERGGNEPKTLADAIKMQYENKE
ncbi:phage scaffolding protein [Candidatus Proelusimicrobium excrementi]|uniref:phage scaffolding protein n=1 Tax=Candidatus Proelusimicrobium excrementi TaxID=3416222 RepID=UPI003C829DDF|nr:phage scaffolding protein [Elusimicrobiaceae bacterium]MBR3927732.1 phage scaffolding protein [Clostridia bacterium]